MHSEFIEINEHHLFFHWSTANRNDRVLTIVIQPFAEEMNKCRHLINNLKFGLNDYCDVLIVDAYGTGDSCGDLTESTSQKWTSDWIAIVDIIVIQGYSCLNIVAVRFGALQLIDLLRHQLQIRINKILLWQPYLQSSTFLQQFFRLKIAEQMATGNKTTQKELEHQLSTGEVVEIAGYPITQNFVSSIYALKDVTALPALYQQTPLLWLETSMLPNISPVCEKGMGLLSQYFAAEFSQLQGPAWWNATELVQSPELIARSVEFLTGKTA